MMIKTTTTNSGKTELKKEPSRAVTDLAEVSG